MYNHLNSVISVRIWSFSDSYFLAFVNFSKQPVV